TLLPITSSLLRTTGARRPLTRLKRMATSPYVGIPISIGDALRTELQPDPIPPEWIVGERPTAYSRVIGASQDRTTTVVIWECTGGRFHWNYAKDELLYVLSGEASLTTEHGDTRRLTAGDVAFLRAGSTCTWQVGDHIRKLAILREPLPSLLALLVTTW